jgi:predicted deacylase
MSTLDVGNAATEAGGKIFDKLLVETMPDGSRLEIPIIVVTGSKNGPALAVLAAVHGDEFEGVRAVIEVAKELEPEKLAGSFVGVPVF